MAEKSRSADPPHSAIMKRIELLISWLLLGGVAISMATVSLGIVIMFLHHPNYLHSAADLHRLTTPGAALPNTMETSLAESLLGRVRPW
jgi:hypothetical protein